jgi:predicted GNAT family N-acyltransferase
MVAFSEEVSKKMGYSKMILHARKVVVLFYQKQGYRTLGEEFLEVGIPHFKMEKDL